MEGTKSPLASSAIWANSIQILVSVAVAFGWITDNFGSEIQATLPQIVASAVGVVTGLIGLWGRWRATKKIA